MSFAEIEREELHIHAVATGEMHLVATLLHRIRLHVQMVARRIGAFQVVVDEQVIRFHEEEMPLMPARRADFAFEAPETFVFAQEGDLLRRFDDHVIEGLAGEECGDVAFVVSERMAGDFHAIVAGGH